VSTHQKEKGRKGAQAEIQGGCEKKGRCLIYHREEVAGIVRISGEGKGRKRGPLGVKASEKKKLFVRG